MRQVLRNGLPPGWVSDNTWRGRRRVEAAYFIFALKAAGTLTNPAAFYRLFDKQSQIDTEYGQVTDDEHLPKMVTNGNNQFLKLTFQV
jgi:hypothetical protein